MDTTADNTGAMDRPELDLAEVAEMPLTDLISSDDSALDNAVRRVLAGLDGEQEIMAAFDSSIG